MLSNSVAVGGQSGKDVLTIFFSVKVAGVSGNGLGWMLF